MWSWIKHGLALIHQNIKLAEKGVYVVIKFPQYPDKNMKCGPYSRSFVLTAKRLAEAQLSRQSFTSEISLEDEE